MMGDFLFCFSKNQEYESSEKEISTVMLQRLCKSGDIDAVTVYINAVKERESDNKLSYILNLKNEQKYTALHTAIFNRHFDIVKVLIDSGSDVDLKCCGTPCLHLALNTTLLPEGKEFGLKCFNHLLISGADAMLKDDNGLTALHLAAEYNLDIAVSELLKTANVVELVSCSHRLTGLTPLHRAAASDSVESAALLLDLGADVNHRSVHGATPLHIAASGGARKVWRLLVSRGADITCEDHMQQTPLDVLHSIKWTLDPTSPDTILPPNSHHNKIKTAVVANPLCSRHFTCAPSATESQSAPPENIKRLEVLINDVSGVLRGSDLAEHIDWVDNSTEAALSDVLRVHEWSYVRHVQAKCEAIQSSDPETEEGIAFIDGDTTISKGTFRAALAAAGAVCTAVDKVVSGEARNSFCPIRPPGHHAGPRGLVKLGVSGGPDSHGFCILNNISIGAAYAMNRHRDSVKKVAIVDFDVHHGNGTEETVRWLKPGLEEVPLVNDLCFGQISAPRYKPWFGSEDPSNVLFVSVHGYGPRERGLEHMLPMAAFYPGSGKTVVPEVTSKRQELSEPLEAAQPFAQETSEEECEAMEMEEGGSEAGSADDSDDEDDSYGSSVGDDDDDEEEEGDHSDLANQTQDVTHSAHQQLRELHRIYATSRSIAQHSVQPLILDVGVPLPSEESVTDSSLNVAGGKAINELAYRMQWRRYFREEIFPRLMEFRPHMVFISAGFDAHRKDSINSGYIALVEEDFEWITDNLMMIANATCGGRVVSALEGGYQLGGEFCSAFAKSVKAHVTALSRGGVRQGAEYSQATADRESTAELQLLQKLKTEREAELARREAARQAALLLREEEDRKLAEQPQEVQQLPISETVVALLSDSAEMEASSKKRRRPQVDYLALDKEMRKQDSGDK